MAPSARKDLSTSITLILPLLLFAAATGALFEVSKWFGGLFVVLLIGIYAVIRRILTARKVNVKTIEVSLLGLLIPIFSIFSFLSNTNFTWARRPFNLLMMTIPLPHLALMWRTRIQLNHPVMLVTSSILMGFHVSSTGSKLEFGIVPSTLNMLVICYALGIKFMSLFMLREKINFTVLRWISLSLVIAFAIAATVCYLLLPDWTNISYGFMMASFALAVLYGYHDFMCYQMKVPIDKWTVESALLPICNVAIKFLSTLIVADYGILGVLAGSGAIQEKNVLWIWVDLCALVVLVHPLYTWVMWTMRKEDPYLPEGHPMDKCTIIGICGIIAVIALNIAIGISYCLVAHPIVIPDPYLLAFIALLFLLLTHFFDMSRTFLAPFLSKLLVAVIGFTVYIIIYGVIILKRESAEKLTTGNFTEPAVGGNVTGEEPSEGMEVEPVKRVLIIAVTLCLALAIHIIGAMILECKKKTRMQASEMVKVPLGPEAKCLDIDYDSDDN